MQVISNKIYCSKSKEETEINNFDGEINIAVDKHDRKVKIKRLIVKCKDGFTGVVDNHEEFFDLAQKTEDPHAACLALHPQDIKIKI